MGLLGLRDAGLGFRVYEYLHNLHKDKILHGNDQKLPCRGNSPSELLEPVIHQHIARGVDPCLNRAHAKYRKDLRGGCMGEPFTRVSLGESRLRVSGAAGGHSLSARKQLPVANSRAGPRHLNAPARGP